MIDVYNWFDKVERYFSFTRQELQFLGISIIVMSFIAGFDDGQETFEFAYWIANFLVCLLAVTIAVIARETAHRIIGLEQGYKVDFKPLTLGLIAGAIISIMSNGKLMFLAYGTAFLQIMEKHRLGYFRYQLGYFHLGTVCLMAGIANMIVAIVVRLLPFIPEPIKHKIIFINCLIALIGMLPIPGLDGPQVLFASRWMYFLAYGSMIGLSIFLIKGFSWWVIILGTILAAITMWLGYYLFIEKKL